MRLSRLLSIVLILSHKNIVTGSELAEHFEVSLRTIYRDLEKLGEAGVPVASLGGKGGGYYLMEGYDVEKLFFTKGEAQAVGSVINGLRGLFGTNGRFNDIVHKFEHLNDGRQKELTFHLSHFSMEDDLREDLQIISQGMDEARTLEFDYINRNLDHEHRIAEPIHIEYRHGTWYLIAWCRNRMAYRKFKLVRMMNLRLGTPFHTEHGAVSEIMNHLGATYEMRSVAVTLCFSSAIGPQLPEYFPKECISPREDGAWLVRDFFPYEEGLIKFILGFGKECTVLDPPQLLEDIAATVKELNLRYNG